MFQTFPAYSVSYVRSSIVVHNSVLSFSCWFILKRLQFKLFRAYENLRSKRAIICAFVNSRDSFLFVTGVRTQHGRFDQDWSDRTTVKSEAFLSFITSLRHHIAIHGLYMFFCFFFQAGHPGALGTTPPKDASFLSQLQAAPPHDTILNMSPSSTLDQRGVPLGQSPQPLIKSIKDELFRLSQGATRKTPITEL